MVLVLHRNAVWLEGLRSEATASGHGNKSTDQFCQLQERIEVLNKEAGRSKNLSVNYGIILAHFVFLQLSCFFAGNFTSPLFRTSSESGFRSYVSDSFWRRAQLECVLSRCVECSAFSIKDLSNSYHYRHKPKC